MQRLTLTAILLLACTLPALCHHQRVNVKVPPVDIVPPPPSDYSDAANETSRSINDPIDALLGDDHKVIDIVDAPQGSDGEPVRPDPANDTEDSVDEQAPTESLEDTQGSDNTIVITDPIDVNDDTEA
ncbi:unnamed protein product [Candidula unifasciata]|uniref:Secreted protein n=1 Tax=Candidula unifasciata TaxID=100452 RepID=A0A8S4A3A6_9EUPU|nr:unnamed protein product [Candidula unifasciata]